MRDRNRHTNVVRPSVGRSRNEGLRKHSFWRREAGQIIGDLHRNYAAAIGARAIAAGWRDELN